jgi:hypothetical protein
MVPGDFVANKKFTQSLSISVSGGQKTNPLWCSQVANEDFATALQLTIEKNGMFSQVLRSEGGDYKLDVRLIQLHQPIAGFNMTVQADVEWRLRETASRKLVWEKVTNRAYTAKMSDAFDGATRLRLANEGAIRESIKDGLGQLSALSF